MAASRVNVEITSAGWISIPLDPDTDGYTKMFVEEVNTNHLGTQWSTINTITEQTATLPDESASFDYDIFVKNTAASEDNPVVLAVTRV